MGHFDGHILNHGNSLHDGHTPISHDIPMNHGVFFVILVYYNELFMVSYLSQVLLTAILIEYTYYCRI